MINKDDLIAKLGSLWECHVGDGRNWESMGEKMRGYATAINNVRNWAKSQHTAWTYKDFCESRDTLRKERHKAYKEGLEDGKGVYGYPQGFKEGNKAATGDAYERGFEAGLRKGNMTPTGSKNSHTCAHKVVADYIKDLFSGVALKDYQYAAAELAGTNSAIGDERKAALFMKHRQAAQGLQDKHGT